MDGWIDGWMDRWMGEPTDGRTERQHIRTRDTETDRDRQRTIKGRRERYRWPLKLSLFRALIHSMRVLQTTGRHRETGTERGKVKGTASETETDT